MANVNFMELIRRPSMDLQLISYAGPALANAALLLAGGCPKKYVASIRALYADNNLVCPNLDRVLKDNPLEDLNLESKSQNKEMDLSLTSLVDQEQYSETQQIKNMLKIMEYLHDKEDVILNQEQYSESQQIKYFLKAMDNVDEITASFNEIEGILSKFDTVSKLPIELKPDCDATTSFIVNQHLRSKFSNTKTHLARTGIANGQVQLLLDFFGENKTSLLQTEDQA